MADGTLIFNTKLDHTGLDSGMRDAANSTTGLAASFGLAAGATGLIVEGVKAAGQAVIGLTKQAVELSASYEQGVGGIETMFKNSASKVIANSEQAYKSAGMSANEYMDTVLSFSSSLIASLGGDTSKAAKLADVAITDMADNANKFGTNIESIQNAYQGFAKGNFYLLDNLSTQYKGTKAEMQRLLDDMNALNASQGKVTNYSIDNMADIINAIHDLQTEMGVTGTTAAEAAQTISGSVNMAKAAWDNFLVGVTSPADTAEAFATALNNVILGEHGLTSLFPRLMEGLGELIAQLAPHLPDLMSGMLEAVMKGLASLRKGIGKSLETMIPSLVQTVTKMIITAIENTDDIAAAGFAIVKGLIIGIIRAIPELIKAIPEIIVALAQALAEAAPTLVSAFVDVFVEVGDAIVEVGDKIVEDVKPVTDKIKSSTDDGMKDLPTLFAEHAGKSVAQFIDALATLAPLSLASMKLEADVIKGAIPLLQAAGESLGKNLVKSSIDPLGLLPNSMKTIIDNTVDIWYDKTTPFPKKIQATFQNMVSLADAAVKDLPMHMIDKAKNVADGFIDGISGVPIKAGNLMKTASDSMLENSKALPDRLKGIIDSAATKMQDSMSSLSTSMNEKMKNTVTGMYDSASDLSSKMSERVTSMVTSMKTAISGINTTMGSYISDMVTSMKTSASGLDTTMSGYITDAVTKMKSAISGINTTMSGYISDMVTDMGTEISKLPLKLKQGVDDAITNMKTALANAVNEMKTAGQNLIDGIKSGVDSKIDQFKNSVVSTFEQVVQRFKDVFGIRSPSRVMRQIGIYCVEGLEQGFGTLDPQFMNKTVQASIDNIDANIKGGIMFDGASMTAGGVSYTQIVNVNKEIATPDELARTLRIESKYGLMKGVAVG